MTNLIIMRNPKLEILHCLGTPLVQYLLSSNIQYQLIIITTLIGLLLVARDCPSHNLPAIVPPIIFHLVLANMEWQVTCNVMVGPIMLWGLHVMVGRMLRVTYCGGFRAVTRVKFTL